jgi:hypothetical protein
VYEYCAIITDCTTGMAIADARVRFDHEGLFDKTTDATGNACSANVGAPGSHDVLVIVKKAGYATIATKVRSGGDELKAHLCLSQLMGGPGTPADAGAGSSSSADGGS